MAMKHGQHRRPIRAGDKQGKLTVLSADGHNSRGMLMWLCRCDCGKEYRVSSSNFRMRQDCPTCVYRRGIALRQKHGGSVRGAPEPLYAVWKGMRQRCSDPNSVAWPHYGAKGIFVCGLWQNDYGAFKDWCLANGWKKGMSIDRLDVTGPYHPDNCEIVTKSENSKRMRRQYHYVRKDPAEFPIFIEMLWGAC